MLLVLATRSSILEDRFYWKVAYPASALIMGNSQPGEGINPAIIEQSVEMKGRMLNIAFDGTNSPYGAPYLKFIKRKLRRGVLNGLFILSVSPEVVSDFADGYGRREEQFMYFDLWSVNIHPNVEFLFRRLGHNNSLLMDILKESEENRNFTNHKNGWCEVKVKHMKPKPKFFRPQFKQELVPSDIRLDYLEETINWLKERGDVILIRMPIDKAALKAERNVYPGFKEVIQGIASARSVPFWDYSDEGDQFIFHDHSLHLESRGAVAFSELLAKDIKQYQKSK